VLHQPCLFQGPVDPVLGHRFQRPGAQFDRHVPIELGHPKPASLQIRQEKTRRVGGNMLADSTLLLGQTTSMDTIASAGLRSGDAAHS